MPYHRQERMINLLEQANHSLRIPMNLQMFGEGDPVDPPVDTPVDPPTDPPSDPVPPTDPPAEPFLSITYNKEQMELDREKAIELAQKGMNYDKVHERYNQLQSDPRLSFVEELAQASGMTVEQYINAVREHQEQQRLEQLVGQGIPDDVAQEILENRKFRQQWESQQQEQAKQEKIKADNLAFMQTYPNVKPDEIPLTVWEEVDKGSSLVDAYTRYENQQLQARIAKLEETLNIRQNNQVNAQTSTGSVTGQGTPPATFFTREQVDAMSQEEVNKNYKAIMDSQKHWK